MTNAELIQKIRIEIERRIKECEATYPKDKDGYWFPEQEEAYAIAEEYKQLLSFLDTLEEEIPTDLEEAAEEYLQRVKAVFLRTLEHPTAKEAFIAGAKWQKQHDAELIEIAYNDGITIGMTKQKEQMLKAAERLHKYLQEKQKEQKPVEWSEEDEKVLSQAIETLEHEDYSILADKLKSLRPSWKPTEEQMDALDKAIPVCMGVAGRDEIAPLESLYEQLKKL